MDKVSYSVWDLFSLIMTGIYTSAMCCVVFFDSTWSLNEKYLPIIDSLSSTIVLIVPFLLMAVGLIVDSYSNYLFNFLPERIKNKQGRNVDKYIANIQVIQENKVEREVLFRVCKSFVENNIVNNNVQVFLARFGFYRNIAMVTLSISLLSVFIQYESLSGCRVFIQVIITLFAFNLFLKRAVQFKSHQEYEVYSQYLSFYVSRK